MTSKSGADIFLLAMEKQAKMYLRNHKIQQIIRWAEITTQHTSDGHKHSTKRISAVFIVLSLSFERALDLNRARSSDFAISRTLDLDDALHQASNLCLACSLDGPLSRALDRDRMLDRDFERVLARDRDRAVHLSRLGIFSGTNLAVLILGH